MDSRSQTRVDRMGRRRAPGQERGLRSPHPELPCDWISKAIRVTMPEEDWARLEALAIRCGERELTGARALGSAIHQLLLLAESHELGLSQGSRSRIDSVVASNVENWTAAHWMDWERRKAMRLLRLV